MYFHLEMKYFHFDVEMKYFHLQLQEMQMGNVLLDDVF